jgi:hypothetical protein
VKQSRRRITIAVTPQTLFHLQTLADACHRGDVGRAVDDLVREYQMAAKIRTKPTEREGFYYVRK